MAQYRLKSIEAYRFDPESQPWPEGVEASEDSSTGYMFTGIGGVQEIAQGDYVISGRWMPQRMSTQEFEMTYELAP